MNPDVVDLSYAGYAKEGEPTCGAFDSVMRVSCQRPEGEVHTVHKALIDRDTILQWADPKASQPESPGYRITPEGIYVPDEEGTGHHLFDGGCS